MKKTSLYLVIAVCALLLATSCWRKQLLTVSRDRFLFDMNGGTIPFIVTADCDWHIEADESASWVTLSQTEGNFGANVSISVSSNPEQIERSTVLKITSFNGRASKKLYVQQKTDVSICF